MKRVIGAAVLAISLCGAGQAMAQGKWYGALSGGYLMPEEVGGTIQGSTVALEYEDGYAVYGALGYAFGSGIRLEAEVGYGSVGFESLTVNGVKHAATGDVDLYSGTVNGFYDIKTGTALTPYLGVGVGIVTMESSNVTAAGVTFTGADSTDPVALGEVGLKYAVTPSVAVGLGYRYSHIFDGEDDIDDDAGHLFKASMTYSF